MIYLMVLGVALLAVLIATPLAILSVRWLEAREPAPAPPAPPEPVPVTTPERIDQIARRGRR